MVTGTSPDGPLRSTVSYVSGTSHEFRARVIFSGISATNHPCIPVPRERIPTDLSVGQSHVPTTHEEALGTPVNDLIQAEDHDSDDGPESRPVVTHRSEFEEDDGWTDLGPLKRLKGWLSKDDEIGYLLHCMAQRGECEAVVTGGDAEEPIGYYVVQADVLK